VAAPRASCDERPVRFEPQPLGLRWYDTGRRRTRRFKDAQAARAFDDERRSAKAAARQAGAVEPAAQQAGS
jgi:hypothetical protein